MGLTFNGSTQHCSRTSAAVTAYPLTMACWSNHADGNQATCMIIEDSANGNGGVILGWDGSHKVYMAAGDGSAFTETSGTSSETNGTWYHIGATFASATSRNVYFNGVSEASSATNRAFDASCNRTRLAWRDNAASPVRKLNGSLADCAIWNVVLDTAEMAALGKGYSPLLIRPTSLVAYWPLSRQSVLISTTTLDRWNGRLDLTETATPTYAEQPRLIESTAVAPGE